MGSYPVAIDPIGLHAHGSDRWIEPNLYPGGGDVRYLIAPDTNDGNLGAGANHTIRAWKSTDKGLTWAEQDGANRIPCKFATQPPNANASRNIAPSILDPVTGIIYGLYFIVDADPIYGTLAVFRFDTTTDTWLAPIAGGQQVPANGSQFPIQEERNNPVAQPVNGLCASLCLRQSDGALVIFFNGDSEIIGGVYYNRTYYDIYTGAWAGVTLMPGQAGVAKDYYAWCCLIDGADLVHFFWLWNTGDLNPPPTDSCELYHNSLSVLNVVSARQLLADGTNIWLMGSSGGRAIVAGMPIAFAGSLYLPVFGANSALAPHNPALRLLTALEGVALPAWSFTTDITPGGTVPLGGPYDIGPIHDTTNWCIVGLSGTASLYAVWSTGGSVYYKVSADAGTTWGAVVTVIDGTVAPFPYRWLLEAAAVDSSVLGMYFPQDGQFYWWPIDYLEIAFAGAALGIICNNPPAGVPGSPYSHQMQISGGTPPYTVVITVGALPPGLSIDNTALITGTPTAPGLYAFTVRVTDSLAATASVACTITISDLNQKQGDAKRPIHTPLAPYPAIDEPPPPSLCDLPPETLLHDWGVLTRSLLTPCQPKDYLYPWIDMPLGGKQLRQIGDSILTMLSINAESVLLTYQVPIGWDGVFTSVVNFYNGTGFLSGSGQFIWRIKVDDYYYRDNGAVLYNRGNLFRPYPLRGNGIRVRSQSTIRFIVKVTSTVGLDAGARVIVALLGWIYPIAELNRGLR